MPQGRSGVNVNTPNTFIVDTGSVYLNIDVDALESSSSSDPIGDAIAGSNTVLLGATRGGSVFNPGRTLRQMPVDGVLGPVRGLVRRQASAPTLQTNIVEASVHNLQLALAGAVSAAAGDFTKITGGRIEDSAYYDNVALLTTYTGNPDLDVVFLIKNVLVMEAPTFNFNDKDEVVMAITFTGLVDVATPNEEVWAIYHPGQAGS